MQKILFVCTGNICRSPTAEGVLRHRIVQNKIPGIETDSAGTHSYHVGEAPDRRSIAAAEKRGIMIADLRARTVTKADFDTFDLILGLDHGHMQLLKHMAPQDSSATVELFLEYAGLRQKEVPDPYYGSTKDFEYVLDLVEEGMDSLLKKLQA